MVQNRKSSVISPHLHIRSTVSRKAIAVTLAVAVSTPVVSAVNILATTTSGPSAFFEHDSQNGITSIFVSSSDGANFSTLASAGRFLDVNNALSFVNHIDTAYANGPDSQFSTAGMAAWRDSFAVQVTDINPDLSPLVGTTGTIRLVAHVQATVDVSASNQSAFINWGLTSGLFAPGVFVTFDPNPGNGSGFSHAVTDGTIHFTLDTFLLTTPIPFVFNGSSIDHEFDLAMHISAAGAGNNPPAGTGSSLAHAIIDQSFSAWTDLRDANGDPVDSSQAGLVLSTPNFLGQPFIARFSQSSATFAIPSAQNVTTSGDFTNSGSIAVGTGSTITITGILNAHGGVISGGGLVLANAGLAVNASSQFTGGGTLRVSGPLTIDPSAQLDLTTNVLILQSTPDAKAATITTLRNQIASGKNGGLWNGPGITSSTIPSTPDTSLALVDNADLHLTTYAGQSLDDNSLIIVQAHNGDANLDHKVDSFDLTKLAAHWNSPAGNAWSAGDFNGDGAVDSFDLTLLAANWQFGVSGSLLAAQFQPSDFILQPSSPVPEPASLLLIALGLPLILRTRPRRSIRS